MKNSTSYFNLSEIMNASSEISSEIEMHALLKKIIRIFLEISSADRGLIILKNEQNQLTIEASGTINEKNINIYNSVLLENYDNICSSIVVYSAETGEIVVINNVLIDHKFSKDKYLYNNQVKSILCVPIIHQNKLLGLIYLENNRKLGTFSKKMINLVLILCSQAAISIKNAKLICNMRNTERQRHELEIAERIQMSLCRKPPEHSELEISAMMKPSAKVGGDYYDVIFDKNNNLWIAIGDASGHGVQAGLVMMMAETLFNNYVRLTDDPDPADAFKKVNYMLFTNVHKKMGRSLFMTMIFLKYLGNGKFTYVGAHLDIIIYRKKSETFENIKTEGIILSIMEDISKFTNNLDFTLDQGDIMILYTDGITEAMNLNENMFEEEGIKKVVRDNVSEPVDVIKNNILNETLKFCNYSQKDDITMIVIRKK